MTRPKGISLEFLLYGSTSNEETRAGFGPELRNSLRTISVRQLRICWCWNALNLAPGSDCRLQEDPSVHGKHHSTVVDAPRF